MSSATAIKELVSRNERLELQLDQNQLVLCRAGIARGIEAFGKLLNGLDNIYRWPARRQDFARSVPPSVLAGQGGWETLPTLFHEHSSLPRGGARLDAVQLRDVRKKGSFNVPSGVEGMAAHQWTLNKVLIGGTAPLAESFKDGLANIFEAFAVTAPEFVTSRERISIRRGLRASMRAAGQLAYLLCGTPNQKPTRNPDQAVEEELQRQQTEGLSPSGQVTSQQFPRLWSLQRGRGDTLAVDFSLLDPAVQNTLRPRLAKLDTEVRRRQRERANEDDPETWLALQLDIMTELAAEFPVLVPQLVAMTAVAACRDDHASKAAARRETLDFEIKNAAPIKARSDRWREKVVERRLSEWKREAEKEAGGVPFSAIPVKEALRLMRDKATASQPLSWWIWLLEAELRFRSSSEPDAICKAIQSVYELQDAHPHSFIIWRPSKWKVCSETRDGRTYYYAQKWNSIQTKQGWLWRIKDAILTVLQAGWNGCYVAVVAPIWGPTGLKALFSPDVFRPSSRINKTTGVLETDPDHKVQSLCSRLRAIWRDIAKSRDRFEVAPDTGILGKNITRPFHMLWVYGVTGCIGSILVLVGQPLLTFVTVGVSIITVATTCIWAPCAGLLRWAGHALCYDTYSHAPLPLICEGVRCVRGVIIVLAAAAGALVVPVCSIVAMVFRMLHIALRFSYDELVFRIVIKCCARVPASDSFLARRTAGPGISARCYYQISPAVAIAAMQAQLELLELDIIEKQLLSAASRPAEAFRNEMSFVLNSLHLSVKQDHPSLVVLLADKRQQEKDVRDVFGARRKDLRSLITSLGARGSRVRQSAADLDRTLELAPGVVQRFAEERIFPRLSDDENAKQDLWDKWDALPGHWAGAARALLSSALSEEFVTSSLEELDADGFCVKVGQPSLDALVTALITADASKVVEPLSHIAEYTSNGKQASAKLGPAVPSLTDLLAEYFPPPRSKLVNVWREVAPVA